MRFGPVCQLGYLVDALEPAMADWTRLTGAGPFFVLPPRRLAALSVDGVPAADADIIAAVALGQRGLQIELIVAGAPLVATFDRVRDAADGWDGRDPVRVL